MGINWQPGNGFRRHREWYQLQHCVRAFLKQNWFIQPWVHVLSIVFKCLDRDPPLQNLIRFSRHGKSDGFPQCNFSSKKWLILFKTLQDTRIHTKCNGRVLKETFDFVILLIRRQVYYCTLHLQCDPVDSWMKHVAVNRRIAILKIDILFRISLFAMFLEKINPKRERMQN